jgi:hypothetical protein
MQAALLSYALFTVLLLLLVIVVLIIIGVKSLRAFLRDRQVGSKPNGKGRPLDP